MKYYSVGNKYWYGYLIVLNAYQFNYIYGVQYGDEKTVYAVINVTLKCKDRF